MGRAPRGLLALALVVLVLTPASVGTAETQAVPGDPPAEKVLILSLPRLRWVDVAEHRPPVLTGFFAESAVASLSADHQHPHQSRRRLRHHRGRQSCPGGGRARRPGLLAR